jgi:hypothetical protein
MGGRGQADSSNTLVASAGCANTAARYIRWMAISSKRRRAIEVDGQRYLWWVAEDEDSPLLPEW